MVVTDTETSMLPGVPGSAICVQRFDDSLNSAIRITYRISLRSSSLREPRYPLLKVVSHWYQRGGGPPFNTEALNTTSGFRWVGSDV